MIESFGVPLLDGTTTPIVGKGYNSAAPFSGVRVVRYDDDGLIAGRFNASGQTLSPEQIMLLASENPVAGERLTIELESASPSRRLVAEVLEVRPSATGDFEQFQILCRFLERLDAI